MASPETRPGLISSNVRFTSFSEGEVEDTQSNSPEEITIFRDPNSILSRLMREATQEVSFEPEQPYPTTPDLSLAYPKNFSKTWGEKDN
jgi:hypothetical protein